MTTDVQIITIIKKQHYNNRQQGLINAHSMKASGFYISKVYKGVHLADHGVAAGNHGSQDISGLEYTCQLVNGCFMRLQVTEEKIIC